MNRTHIKNALLGVALALAAAYSFSIILLTVLIGPRGLMGIFTTLPLFGLFYTSWIVVPLGAALGMLIPRIAAGKSRWTAALHGAGYGAVGGLAAMICFVSAYGLVPAPPPLLWVGVAVYSAVWVGAYAYIRAKAPVAHR